MSTVKPDAFLSSAKGRVGIQKHLLNGEVTYTIIVDDHSRTQDALDNLASDYGSLATEVARHGVPFNPVERQSDTKDGLLDSLAENYGALLTEAARHGIFSPKETYTPSDSTLRCEVLHELWREVDQPMVECSAQEVEDMANLAGDLSYYREAVTYFWVSSENFRGLYNWRDIGKPATWGELAYILYLVMDLDKTLDWNTINPGELNVSAVVEKVGGIDTVVESLHAYKQTPFFNNYLHSIRKGERFVPMVMFCAFKDLQNITGDLVQDDWLLREVSKGEFEKTLAFIRQS